MADSASIPPPSRRDEVWARLLLLLAAHRARSAMYGCPADDAERARTMLP